MFGNKAKNVVPSGTDYTQISSLCEKAKEIYGVDPRCQFFLSEEATEESDVRILRRHITVIIDFDTERVSGE